MEVWRDGRMVEKDGLSVNDYEEETGFYNTRPRTVEELVAEGVAVARETEMRVEDDGDWEQEQTSRARKFFTRLTSKFHKNTTIPGSSDDGYWGEVQREVWAPQKIRLIREQAGQGTLYQGRVRDSLQFKKGIHFHLGHDDIEAINDGVVKIKYTISDGSNDIENWQQVMRLANWAVDAIKQGYDVLSTCDMGASRSTTFAAMIVCLLDDVAFDANMRFNIRNPAYDEGYSYFLPNPSLWREAKVVVDVMRDIPGESSLTPQDSNVFTENGECES